MIRQSVLGLAALLMSFSAGAAAQTASSPCRGIRVACEKAGFEPGSGPASVDNACVRPIVFGTTPPRREKLPTVDPKVVAECRANLAPSRTANSSTAPAAGTAPATPSNTDQPAATSARQPTAVAPHNPPPTDPGPDR